MIGFGYPLATCTSHPPPKASLAHGGWVLSKFKPSQVPRQFDFLGFQTTWLSTQHSMLIFSSQLLHHPKLGLDQQGHPGHHIQGKLGLLLHLSLRPNMKIDCILREHLFWGERQYLVHWHGYGPSEDCWIPLADMSNARKLLKAWEDERTPLWHSPRCHRDVS